MSYVAHSVVTVPNSRVLLSTGLSTAKMQLLIVLHVFFYKIFALCLSFAFMLDNEFHWNIFDTEFMTPLGKIYVINYKKKNHRALSNISIVDFKILLLFPFPLLKFNLVTMKLKLSKLKYHGPYLNINIYTYTCVASNRLLRY